MAERISVPRPAGAEELRAWAETIADLHYVGSIVVERGETFLPGEDVDEIRIVWHDETTPAFIQIVNALSAGATAATQIVTPGQPTDVITPGQLTPFKLDGATGATKRSGLGRMKDYAMSFIRSDPQTEETRRAASEATERYMEVGGVALDTLHAALSEVPGVGTALKAGQEAVQGIGHRLGFRRSRRH